MHMIDENTRIIRSPHTGKWLRQSKNPIYSYWATESILEDPGLSLAQAVAELTSRP